MKCEEKEICRFVSTGEIEKYVLFTTTSIRAKFSKTSGVNSSLACGQFLKIVFRHISVG